MYKKNYILLVAILLFSLLLFPTCAKKKPDRVKDLISDLDYVDKFIQIEAAEELAALKDPRAVDPLIAILSDPNEEVRTAGVIALGKLKDPRAIIPLIQMFRDESIGVRKNAAVALQNMGFETIDPLIASLTDPDWRVREKAAEALGKKVEPKAVVPLINTLADKDTEVRQAAVNALAMIGDQRAINPLEQLLIVEVKLQNWDIVEDIQDALQALGQAEIYFKERE